jgi:hypothetical protein
MRSSRLRCQTGNSARCESWVKSSDPIRNADADADADANGVSEPSRGPERQVVQLI